MMCPQCEGKGWIETYQGRDNGFVMSLSQCPNRCNISGYSNEVQRRMSMDVNPKAIMNSDFDSVVKRQFRPNLRLVK